MSNFFAITFTLFLVIDALGSIPLYLSLLKPYSKRKRQMIALRELVTAFLIMLAFHYLGRILLPLLGISKMTVQIAGGIVLFLIAIRLIFSHDGEQLKWRDHAPFIVPIATPIFAGPSLLAVIMIFAQDKYPESLILGAIFTAWLASSILFWFAEPIYAVFKDKGLAACERLTGLIIALIAVQMFLTGVTGVIAQ